MALPIQIQYVHADGNDHSDGLSWATAKQTVRQAYNVLPDGGGTIYIAGGTVDIGSPGIWIGGNAQIDPNWWGMKSASFIGVGEQVTLQGHTGDRPVIWLPNPDRGLYFENLKVEGDKALYVGISPDGTTSIAGGAANCNFVNCYFSAFNGAGPCTWLGFCFWVRFYRCRFQAASRPFSSDERACILARGSTVAGTGFMLRDCVGYGGGIKFYVMEHGNTCGAGIDNWEVESNFEDPLPALVHVIGLNSASAFTIHNVAPADANTATSEPTVWIEGDARSANRVTVGHVTGDVVGPCVLQGAAGRTDKPASPLREKQTGFLGGALWGQHDSARRQFGPVAVRFKNLADAEAYAAAHPGAGGKPAPDGTTHAIQPSEVDSHFYVSFARPVSAGDWLIAGGWIQGNGSYQYQAMGAGVPNTTLSPAFMGDGDWQWVGGCTQVIASTSAAVVGLGGHGSGTGERYYGPVLLHIPAGTISDNEAHALAAHLQSYPATAEPGDLAIMPGQRVTWAGDVSPPPPPPPPPLPWMPPAGINLHALHPAPGDVLTAPGITASPVVDLEVVVVARKTAATPGTNYLRFVYGVTAVNQFEAALSHHEATDGTHWHAVAGKAAVDSVRSTGAPIALNMPGLLRGRWQGGPHTVQLSVNDAAAAAVPYSANVQSASPVTGAWVVSASGQPVEVLEVLVWNRLLTAGEWADVRDHLRAAYGISG